MDVGELQRTLVQVLECYRRCGVTHLSSSPEAIAPEWIEALETLQAPQETTVAAQATAPSPQPLQPEPKQPKVESLAAEVANTAASSPSTKFSSSAPSTESGTWTLPVMDLPQRDGKFDELNQQVMACRNCTKIVDYRHQTVFGVGRVDAKVCFMGEAPGADEDRQGEPFVGRAGQLLTKIIQAMKLSREEVYILNALKCRPPQNRTPVPEEIQNCRGFVEAQLEVIQPEYIVCLGAVAVRSLLQCDLPIGRLRGKFYHYRGAKVVITYHPSYLLRNESAKRFVWDDMKMLMREMGTLAE